MHAAAFNDFASFPFPMRPRLRGLGTEVYSPTVQATQTAAVSTAGAVGSAVGGPLGGAIASAIAEVGVAISDLWSGCGNTCTEASDLANQTEPLLQENLAQYLAASPRYASMQSAALANFESAWNSLVSGCSNPALGSAGQNCISERQQGACYYQTSPGGWSQENGEWVYTYPGANGSGSSCWNWFVGYHDPIANDPAVVPDPVPGASTVSSLLSSVGIPTGTTVFGLPLADVLMIAGALLALKLVLG